MKKEDFCDVMGEIREDFILEAREKVKVRHWRSWGALAACLCLVAALAFVRWQPSTTNTEAVACGFTMEEVPGATYFPLTWEEKQKYKLPEAPTEADLGEPMGAVTSCEDETLIGSSVYHAAAYPTLDSLCIVASPRGYAYYLCEALSVSAMEGESMNVLLEVYGLPDTLAAAEVLEKDFTPLHTLEDPQKIDTMFAILSTVVNQGKEAGERRFADAWYAAYGNDEVRYSEAEGHCVFAASEAPSEPVTEMDGEGNIVVSNSRPPSESVYDKAQALWTAGERILRLTTVQGFSLELDFFPSIQAIFCHDGCFVLTDAQSEALAALLEAS